MTGKALGCVTGLAVLFCATGAQAAQIEVHKTYYESGAVKGKFPVKNGKLEGTAQWFYESGALGALMQYRENKLNGVSKLFYESGGIKKITRLVDNKPVGMTSLFSSKGVLVGVERHQEGATVNRWFFDEQGRPVFCEEYSPPPDSPS